MALRGLIFDFDGLIVDTETAIVTAWEAVHAADGRAADRAVLHALVGHAGVQADIWQAYPPEQDRAELEARLQAEARRRCASAPLLPGVRELFDAAVATGMKLAVASNSSHRHVEGHLEARGLLGRLDAVVCREDVARGKPAPDVYLLALKKLELGVEEAVAFEDSMPGHEAAAAAGLRVVVVPNPVTRRDAFPHAAWRVDSLAELSLGRLEDLICASGAARPGGEGMPADNSARQVSCHG